MPVKNGDCDSAPTQFTDSAARVGEFWGWGPSSHDGSQGRISACAAKVVVPQPAHFPSPWPTKKKLAS